jgi:hypothetical protein
MRETAAKEPLMEFEEWIKTARAYAISWYGSDIELGSDDDMADYFVEEYDAKDAVDDVMIFG